MRTLYKYFVFSDVHGEYDALMRGLKEAGYDSNNPQHKLVSLGDNFDRGPDSRKIFTYLTQNHAICIKGNHDAMFQEYLEKGMDGEFVLFNILHNGLGETIKSFTRIKDNQFDIDTLEKARNSFMDRQKVLQWLQNMPIFYETDTLIFVHAGINPDLPDWRLTDEHYALWDIEDSNKYCPNVHNKIIIFGHHHAFRVRENGLSMGQDDIDIKDVELATNSYDELGNRHRSKVYSFGNTDENRPYVSNGKIAIDGCTNLTKKVNILVVEDYEKEKPKEEPELKKEETIIHSINQDGIRITASPEAQWYTTAPGVANPGYVYTTTTTTRL